MTPFLSHSCNVKGLGWDRGMKTGKSGEEGRK